MILRADEARFAVRIALQQVRRRARRSVGGLLGIAGGLVLTLMQLGFQGALYDSAVRIHRLLDGEVVLIPREYDSSSMPIWLPRGALPQAMAHPQVANGAPLDIQQVPIRNIDTFRARALLVIGLDLDNPAIHPSHFGPGYERLRLPRTALFDIKSQPVYGAVAKRLDRDRELVLETSIAARAFQVPLAVVGTYGIGGSVTVSGSAAMSLATLAEILGLQEERVLMGVLQLRPGADPRTVARELESLLPPDVAATTRDELVERELHFWKEDTPIGFLFDLGAFLGYVICAIYVAQVLFQIIEENLSEYAVLKTFGYPQAFFMLIVTVTGISMVAAAIPPAIAASVIVYAVCEAGTQLDMTLTAGRVAGVGGFALGIGILAGLLAQRRLSRADPAVLL